MAARPMLQAPRSGSQNYQTIPGGSGLGSGLGSRSPSAGMVGPTDGRWRGAAGGVPTIPTTPLVRQGSALEGFERELTGGGFERLESAPEERLFLCEICQENHRVGSGVSVASPSCGHEFCR
eukprot:gene37432-35743_t